MKLCLKLAGIFLMIGLSASNALSFRCGAKIVSVGDTRAEVLLKCGDPAFTEERTEEYTTILYDNRRDNREYTEETHTIVIEEWVYNFGPNQFLQFLEFENGKLKKIESGHYGYTQLPDRIQSRCLPAVSEGDRKIDVMIKCGTPTSKEETIEERTHTVKKDHNRYIRQKYSIKREEWTYNFGAGQFICTVTFSNGRVTGIHQGNYGY